MNLPFFSKLAARFRSTANSSPADDLARENERLAGQLSQPPNPFPRPRKRPGTPPEASAEVPASASTERALLGSLLLENRHIAEAAQQLAPEDFHVPAHRKIFRCMSEMHERHEPADLITVSEELKRRAELEPAGGVAYLASLTEGVLLRESVAPYVRILRQKSGLRNLLRAGEELMRCASLPDATLEDCKARWAELFDDRRLRLTTRLRACAAGELLGLELPARGMVLAPVIPTQGLAMLYSPRGVGKTYLALAMAWAVATGTEFLRWRAPQPRKVLFVDGELPATTLQERLAAIRGSSTPSRALSSGKTEAARAGDAGSCEPSGHGNLRLITPDLQEFGVPDISTRTGQALIENELEGAELLVLDNLSALLRSGNENEGESWLPVAEWGLRLRQRGVSVLFLHHAGKSGAQRGTSRREDLLDTVIALKRPPDYCATQGLRCELRFEKARGFHGEAARPFEITMNYGAAGEVVWSTSQTVEHQDPLLEAAAVLFRQGLSVREVAEQLGVSAATAGRRRRQLGEAALPAPSQPSASENGSAQESLYA
jgi:putative DNA primase/helicase